MAVRTFLDFSIVAGGTPQPIVGTTLSAAAAPNVDTRDTRVSLQVADSRIAQQGDWVLIQETDGTLAERHKVYDIPDGTHIRVANLLNSHASGARVILSAPIQSMYIQEQDGNTGTLFVGNRRDMVTATGVGLIDKLMKVASGVQPVETSDSRSGAVNTGMSSDYWIDGTTADKYRVTLGQV